MLEEKRKKDANDNRQESPLKCAPLSMQFWVKKAQRKPKIIRSSEK